MFKFTALLLLSVNVVADVAGYDLGGRFTPNFEPKYKSAMGYVYEIKESKGVFDTTSLIADGGKLLTVRLEKSVPVNTSRFETISEDYYLMFMETKEALIGKYGEPKSDSIKELKADLGNYMKMYLREFTYYAIWESRNEPRKIILSFKGSGGNSFRSQRFFTLNLYYQSKEGEKKLNKLNEAEKAKRLKSVL